MNTRLRILHVVPRLNRGGGGASVLHEWMETGGDTEVAFLSLEADVDVSMLREAMRRRIRTHIAPSPEDQSVLLSRAEVVVVHFWQCPSIYDFFHRLNGRQLRLVIYSRVRGVTPPQILHPDLLALADGWISTAPPELPFDGPHMWMPAVIDPALAAAPMPNRPQTPFRLVHCNTLNPSKMHPDFKALHEGFDVDIYGVGGGEAILSAFDLQGFVADWWHVTTGQVLSYPLHPATWSSSDKAVQEALFTGLPAVLLQPTGLAPLVGPAGLVATDATDFRARLHQLAEDVTFRARLAEAGRDWAETHLHPRRNARRLHAFYLEIRDLPPTEKHFEVPLEAYLAAVHPATAPPGAAWHIAHAEGGTHHWQSARAGSSRM